MINLFRVKGRGAMVCAGFIMCGQFILVSWVQHSNSPVMCIIKYLPQLV